jgi:hypothetical protein
MQYAFVQDTHKTRTPQRHHRHPQQHAHLRPEPTDADRSAHPAPETKMISIQCGARPQQTRCNRLLYTGIAQKLDINGQSAWLTRPRWEVNVREKKHRRCTTECDENRPISMQCRILKEQSSIHQPITMRDQKLGIIGHLRECPGCHEVAGFFITDVFKPELFTKWCPCVGGIDKLPQYCKRSVMFIEELVHTRPLSD